MSTQAKTAGMETMRSTRRIPSGRVSQQGVALFVGLVFLVMLTLIALVVMKGTLLEIRMATASARHEQAFEAAETMRAIPEALLYAVHRRNARIGGAEYARDHRPPATGRAR